jgi:Zn-finger nucleic acid-binding protein
MSDRQGVEIDYCPQCRGVWLDRGELDKLIDRSAQMQDSVAAPRSAPPVAGGHHPSYGYAHPHKRKVKSWLEDIFD